MLTKPLLIVAGVSIVLLGILGFLLKQSYAANGALEVKLAGANAVIQQREEDMKLSAIEIAKLHGKVEQINATAAPVRERIIQLPATTNCVQSPAMQEAVGGVRALLGK